eukprot:scaffold774_cov101-Isochrysis_galbana.AAC.2
MTPRCTSGVTKRKRNRASPIPEMRVRCDETETRLRLTYPPRCASGEKKTRATATHLRDTAHSPFLTRRSFYPHQKRTPSLSLGGIV